MRVFSSCSHVFLRHKNQCKKSAKTFLSIITKLSPFSNTKMYFFFKSTKKVHRLSDSLERRQKKRRATFLALPHWVNLPYYDYCASLINKSWYHPSHNSLSLSLSLSLFLSISLCYSLHARSISLKTSMTVCIRAYPPSWRRGGSRTESKLPALRHFTKIDTLLSDKK